MSREHVIQKKHLSKLAVVYVRQSTAKQVAHNQESTRRQYQLSDKARVLGWPEPRVQIIDDDLGLSGASSECRTGFQRLVSTVGMGEVGIPKAPRPVLGAGPSAFWSQRCRDCHD